MRIVAGRTRGEGVSCLCKQSWAGKKRDCRGRRLVRNIFCFLLKPEEKPATGPEATDPVTNLQFDKSANDKMHGCGRYRSCNY